MAEPPGGPLDGVLVADFSRVLAGPYATMLLADMGAEVVKVEGPSGDETRTWTPPVRDDVSTYYLGINRGKRSIALDLRDEADSALGRELARRADVVIENFKPGGLAKYGLDFATVRAANPGVVYASISGFGAGEGANVPGYDLMVQAISGLMSLTGDPDGPPYRAGISVFDVMAGNHAVIGILAALRHRDATGEGQHVEVNLLSSALTGLVNHSSAYVAAGRGAVPDGQRAPQRLPLRAAADRRQRPHRGRRQRRPFPQALRGARHPGDRRGPALRPQRRPHREPRGTAPDPHRAPRAQGRGGVVRPARRGGRAVRPDQHHRRRVRDGGAVRARPGRRGRRGRPGVPTTRHPIRFSATPASYALPPPELDEHGAELRAWLTAPQEDPDRA